MVSAAATDADAGHNLGWRYLLPAGGVAIATGLVFGHRRDWRRQARLSLAFAVTASAVSAADALAFPGR
jgi:hypothetical protein